MTRSSGRRNSRAFTLVELLVVIGIIAVLIGVLLPALNKARQSANNIKCMANLRSIGQAINIYATVSKGVLPYGYWDGSNPYGSGVVDARRTDWRLLVQSTLSKQSADNYTDAANSGAYTSKLATDVFTDVDVPDNIGVLSYAAHPRLMPVLNIRDPIFFTTGKTIWLSPYKLSRIRRAAEVLLIADANLAPLNQFANRMQANATLGFIDKKAFNGGPGATPTNLLDDYSRAGILPTYGPNTSIDPSWGTGTFNVDLTAAGETNPAGWSTIRFRHLNNSAANVLMADGHVETHRYKLENGVPVCTLKRMNVNVNPQ
ncbi:hypothetical protein BH09PLA1_BH09PLA1_08290 [soil metagenome]